jgi:hypothetical protein
MDRILKNITKDISGCWIWNGGKTGHGYGNIKINGINVSTHIYSYEQKYGKIQKPGKLKRLCENKACCNPDHYKLADVHEPNYSYDFKSIAEDIKSGMREKAIRQKYNCSHMTYHRYRRIAQAS